MALPCYRLLLLSSLLQIGSHQITSKDEKSALIFFQVFQEFLIRIFYIIAYFLRKRYA